MRVNRDKKIVTFHAQPQLNAETLFIISACSSDMNTEEN